MSLTEDLRREMEVIRRHALDYGLDFFEVIFEVLDWRQVNEVAALGGFPNRYPHWRFGMEYEKLSKSYAYGLSKIYEMVINTDPCYAYLLRSNAMVDQKMVMAHVYGHSDFFKCNEYFGHTNRKMMDEMANHRTRVMRHIDDVGYDKVEAWIDVCLSLENLIDVHGAAIARAPREETAPRAVQRLGGTHKGYMERYINPPEFIEAQRERMAFEDAQGTPFPEHPERDILQFLCAEAPLEEWERDILSIIREEAIYFAPQGQTKIMNEGWACVAGETRIATDRGFVPAQEIVEQRLPVRVFDGERWQQIVDYAKFPSKKSVKIRTRRGYELSGSATHQILTDMNNDTWARLDALAAGDTISLSPAQHVWPDQQCTLVWEPKIPLTLQSIADQTQVNISTVVRHMQGTCVSRSATALDPLLASYTEQGAATVLPTRRKSFHVPEFCDENLGAFLGYMIGDGHISRVKRVLGLTTGDDEAKQHFAGLCEALFGLSPKIKRDASRWRVLLHCEDLADFLVSLGLTTGPSARKKQVPELIWRSPKNVVVAFLRALFDADGYAGKQGVIYSTFSEQLGQDVQNLLHALGILSRRRRTGQGWHVHVMGRCAKQFAELVGFGLSRKQIALQQYVDSHQQWKRVEWADEVVSVELLVQDVYDFTVENSHRYVAHGFINHNSFWHTKIMTQHMLKDHELIDYADHHSGTVAMQPGGQLNPYKIGIELFRDIEERWNMGRFGPEYNQCTDMKEKARWDKQTGLGREKIFQVRRIYNDVTFIDEFLTPEFCKQHKFFVYAYNIEADQYEIADRTFETIKEKLLMQLTNAGNPVIDVIDANYTKRGELLLKHKHQGGDLRRDYAQKTLEKLYKVWRRPVNIETLVEGVPRILTFDGENHHDFRPHE